MEKNEYENNLLPNLTIREKLSFFKENRKAYIIIKSSNLRFAFVFI